MKTKILNAFRRLSPRGFSPGSHFGLPGPSPITAWAPEWPYLQVLLRGRMALQYYGFDGVQDVTLGPGDMFFGLKKSWGIRGWAGPRRSMLIQFLPHYMRFTLGERSAPSPSWDQPDIWYHTSKPRGPMGALLLQSLEWCAGDRAPIGIWGPLLYSLLEYCRVALSNDKGQRMGRRRETYEHTRDYVLEHSGSPINLRIIAHGFDLSPNYLSRLFAAEGSEPFNHFLKRIRMERAARLLVSTRLSVGEISRATGFSGTGYFIKVFSKHFGATPGSWIGRRSLRGNAIPGSLRPSP